MRGSGLIRLCVVAAVAGALAGVVGAAFRASLVIADESRVAAVEWLHRWPHIGWIVPVIGAALAVAIARFIVVRVPSAAGSGVQRIEAAVRSQVVPETIRVVPAKFVGGFLAIGSGLALGREGPTVQMSAAIGSKLSRSLSMSSDDQNTTQAALAGAGLAVAFNAPLGGAIFVVEELTKSVRMRTIAAAVVATAVAIAVLRALSGDHPDFAVVATAPSSLVGLVPWVVFGVLLGLLGAAYNRLVLVMLDGFNRLTRIPLLARAAIVGGGVGLLGWFFPGLVGGGDNLTQDLLLGSLPLAAVVAVLLVRFVLGPLSYSVGAPGGLFAPLLVVGAASGALFGAAVSAIAPGIGVGPIAGGVVGMSVFFAAVVRAPITGIALVTEMTATTSQLVPMLLACGAAVVTATIIGSEPIYDTLRHRMLGQR